MKIKKAEFVISNKDIEKCPKGIYPEYAFIGRSNVGKSSLINMLTNRKKLAKTSSTPGKTQLINHFLINENWYLVDLPGYGFAKVPLKEKRKWAKFINIYINKRENLICVFVLIDIRIPPQNKDLNFMKNLGINGIPFVIAFTKTDKIKKNILKNAVKNYKTKILEIWEELPNIFITSAVKNTGKEEILSFIEETNKNYSLQGNKIIY